MSQMHQKSSSCIVTSKLFIISAVIQCDELKKLFVCFVCHLDISEPEVAVNGLISVPSESSDKLPSEVSAELASIQDAGIECAFLKGYGCVQSSSCTHSVQSCGW